MKSKDEKIKFTLKNIIYFSSFLMVLIYSILFYNFYFSKSNVYAKETLYNIPEVKISNANEIEIQELININCEKSKKEEYETKEIELEYITKYRTNKDLPKGMVQVIQDGREGKQIIVVKKVYENKELILEEQISSKITVAAINKIVEIGEGKSVSNYKVKIGDKIYVTSDRLAVMLEPDENSQKITTIEKGKELKVEEIKNDWYKIKGSGVEGFIKSECTTYLNNNYKEENSNFNKTEIMSKLSFDMSLNTPSGLSLEQFKKILSDSQDKNNIFENNAEYFYYIEKQYKINGVFVAAIGIHESAWGTSKIAKDKNNLFGYGAYDSNPYNGAYSFSDCSEAIDLIARVLVKYYINPKGTNIYGGEQAIGTYYNGATLAGVNQRYATDKNWANGVYSHMKYLYNKL